MSRITGASFAISAFLSYQGVSAASLDDCAAMARDSERLRCYDSIAGRGGPTHDTSTPSEQVPLAPSMPVPARSKFAEHWELRPQDKQGTLRFTEHRPNYLLATYNRSPNNTPYRPLFQLDPQADGLSKFELAYQLGFKLKLLEGVQGSPLDLWFGYTQRSFWQASNREASSPFRETNYEPELMLVLPVNWGMGDLKLKFLNLAVAHQSNGQGTILSRSWNRLYLQAGIEAGDLSVSFRTWRRIDSEGDDDDNPDIVRYMGRGEIVGTLNRNGHEYELMGRCNPRSGKGALQFGWAFPLAKHLQGYVQYFSGYGYTLVDYNDFQRVLGLGLRVAF
ncbi:phospholipase A [Ramlibacter sp. AN1015]|uniref:phospholipase A n=1 Tax=Ramlibacter sp. AN1015 TaxID=3133428 RepID=UPI0030C34B63